MQHFLLLSFLLISSCLSAQFDAELDRTEEGSFTRHYAEDSSLSTLRFRSVDGLNGYVVAYNHQGEEVYRSETSYRAGSRTVEFRYHANGRIKEARYHWQPDGGIQSGGSITTFDTLGNKIQVREEITSPHQLHQLMDGGALRR